MAIISTTFDPNTNEAQSTETLYRGRVIKVEKSMETRNHSDTLDYSDFRTTDCTWALVYLGRHGVPPMNRAPRRTTGYYGQPRDLEPIERFAWVDCTNLFTWRGSPHLTPTVDTIDMQLVFGGDDMLADLQAWEKAIAEERAEFNRRAEEAAQEALRAQAKQAQKSAQKLAKESQLKAAADALLALIPPKGTTVTIEGFTGQVFWSGVSKYRGAYNARAGVKDAKGNVIWVDATKF